MFHSFEWYSIIPGLKLLEPHAHVAHAVIVALILISLAVLANRSLRRGSDIIPAAKFTPATFYEMAYETVMGLLKDAMGHHAQDFIVLVGSLALFILFSNLLGLVPGFAPPTDNINTTAALALTVFLATHYYGFRAHGIKYLKQFVGPFWWLAWLMIPLEIISHLARPLSLTLRLFGNLMGDHLVFAIFVSMAVGLTKFIVHGPAYTWLFALASPFIPIITMVLGIFVAVVQTFVFLLLTMTYFAGAVSEHH